jgi:glycosyltransferase involved in cell wall biosynthesis
MPITTVPNAVDLLRFTPGSRAEARVRAGLGTSRFVVLLMANLAEHKGQITAIRATSLLRARGVDVECWLAGEDRSGDGQFAQRLKELATELGVTDRVRFLGFRSDGPDLFRAADAVVLPSTHEGLPLSLLEAQATGTPVVASDLPGILEVVEDERTGYVVRADDPEGYADRLERLSREPLRRESIVAAASAQVQREYSWDTLNERMFKIYESLTR